MANLLQLTPHSFATTSDNHVRKATPSMAFGPMVLQSKLCAKVTRCYSSKLEAAPSRHAKRRCEGRFVRILAQMSRPVMYAYQLFGWRALCSTLIYQCGMPPGPSARRVTPIFPFGLLIARSLLLSLQHSCSLGR
eukprot:2742047-Pyramimonas_sp.AAC.2